MLTKTCPNFGQTIADDELISQYNQLRSAIVDFIGTDDPRLLNRMRDDVADSVIDPQDHTAIIGLIHSLIQTQ